MFQSILILIFYLNKLFFFFYAIIMTELPKRRKNLFFKTHQLFVYVIKENDKHDKSFRLYYELKNMQRKKYKPIHTHKKRKFQNRISKVFYISNNLTSFIVNVKVYFFQVKFFFLR